MTLIMTFLFERGKEVFKLRKSVGFSDKKIQELYDFSGKLVSDSKYVVECKLNDGKTVEGVVSSLGIDSFILCINIPNVKQLSMKDYENITFKIISYEDLKSIRAKEEFICENLIYDEIRDHKVIGCKMLKRRCYNDYKFDINKANKIIYTRLNNDEETIEKERILFYSKDDSFSVEKYCRGSEVCYLMDSSGRRMFLDEFVNYGVNGNHSSGRITYVGPLGVHIYNGLSGVEIIHYEDLDYVYGI